MAAAAEAALDAGVSAVFRPSVCPAAASSPARAWWVGQTKCGMHIAGFRAWGDALKNPTITASPTAGAENPGHGWAARTDTVKGAGRTSSSRRDAAGTKPPSPGWLPQSDNGWQSPGH